MPWWKAVGIALDQLLNALLGGWPDETLSSRAHRLRLAGRPGLATCIDGLFWLLCRDEDHCRESFESERLGRQQPPEARWVMSSKD